MRAEGEQTDEVILSRGNACAPPHPTMYMGSGDVQQKRRVRRACRSKTEGEGAHGSRHMKPASVGEICSAIFCSRNGSAPKSQTPKSLSAVSSRRVSVAARRSSRITQKHIQHPPSRTARQRSEAGRRSSRIMPKKQRKRIQKDTAKGKGGELVFTRG